MNKRIKVKNFFDSKINNYEKHLFRYPPLEYENKKYGKKFLICFLQHRDAIFLKTAFLHLHYALSQRSDLANLCKIVFACSTHQSSEIWELLKKYSNFYDIEIFECEPEYLKKVNAILQKYSTEDFSYYIKHDEDILISNKTWISLLSSVDKELAHKDILLATINLSTGIPSWFNFLISFFPEEKQNMIFKKLSGDSIPNFLWGNDYSEVNKTLKNRIWDENNYWNMIETLNYDYKGIHPIRTNIFYSYFFNSEILKHYKNFQKIESMTQFFRINDRYFCNSFFAMDYKLYHQIILDKSLYIDIFDEVPINKYRKKLGMNFSFLNNSLGVHIMYNSVYGQNFKLFKIIPISGLNLEKYFIYQYYFKISNLIDNKLLNRCIRYFEIFLNIGLYILKQVLNNLKKKIQIKNGVI